MDALIVRLVSDVPLVVRKILDARGTGIVVDVPVENSAGVGAALIMLPTIVVLMMPPAPVPLTAKLMPLPPAGEIKVFWLIVRFRTSPLFGDDP